MEDNLKNLNDGFDKHNDIDLSDRKDFNLTTDLAEYFKDKN